MLPPPHAIPRSCVPLEAHYQRWLQTYWLHELFLFFHIILYHRVNAHLRNKARSFLSFFQHILEVGVQSSTNMSNTGAGMPAPVLLMFVSKTESQRLR